MPALRASKFMNVVVGALVIAFALFVLAHLRDCQGRAMDIKLLGESSNRRSVLSSIGDSIERFRDARGRSPGSMAELSAFDPDIDALLTNIEHAPAPYEIDFAAVGATQPSVVIRDPGYTIASGYDLSSYRLCLLSDGLVVPEAQLPEHGVR